MLCVDIGSFDARTNNSFLAQEYSIEQNRRTKTEKDNKFVYIEKYPQVLLLF